MLEGTSQLRQKLIRMTFIEKFKCTVTSMKFKPIDAKIDRVWKAIPGYNGLSVNIKASYQKMKANGEFDKNKIVYKEIPPNIHLEDLDSRTDL